MDILKCDFGNRHGRKSLVHLISKEIDSVLKYKIKNAANHPADLTVSKGSGTRYRIEIHSAVLNHVYLLISFMKLVETLLSSSVKKIISLPEIWIRIKLYLDEKFGSKNGFLFDN